jgi:hypothetical protein
MIRLGKAQRKALRECAESPQRYSPGNPMMRSLAHHGLVESKPHISAWTGKPTCDRLWTATPEGKAMLEAGE